MILHFEVDDVERATAIAQEAGARLLLEPTETPWGWKQAMIAGRSYPQAITGRGYE